MEDGDANPCHQHDNDGDRNGKDDDRSVGQIPHITLVAGICNNIIKKFLIDNKSLKKRKKYYLYLNLNQFSARNFNSQPETLKIHSIKILSELF